MLRRATVVGPLASGACWAASSSAVARSRHAVLERLPASGSLSSSIASSVALTTPSTANACEQRRFFKFAKSQFGFKLLKRGARKYPTWRGPIAGSKEYRTFTHAPVFWKQNLPKNPRELLPRSNFVVNNMTGHFCLPRDQIYTLQHATSSVPVRIKRFPTTYTFTNPSRWTIGTRLTQWAVPRARITDEVAISKKQRLVYVKLGLIAE